MTSLIDLSAVPTWLIWVVLAITLWKLVWYALALYASIENKDKKWFVILFIAAFILNDAGILAIVYLGMINKKTSNKKSSKKK